MDATVYDYVIIGAGAAGLQLALAMIDDPFFVRKKMLILEKDEKERNDRTWCFWEKGTTRWDQLITKAWNLGQFITKDHNIPLNLHPYKYKMLRSEVFYHLAKTKINEAPNIDWIQDEVMAIQSNHRLEIRSKSGHYYAKHVFDSRVDPAFYQEKDHYYHLLQHFKGWYIETDTDTFDPSQFIMMDYRLKWKNSTSFIYVLPITKRKSLVEFTFFSPALVEDEVYDKMLQQYLGEVLHLTTYNITEVEQGIIPMSNYPFHLHHTDQVTKIGTAGGWVKPSSGYSFKNAERFSKKVIENIKSGASPEKGIAKGRHRKYDTLFLDILYNKNETGEALFSSMYRNNHISQILKFLDEETSFPEDLKIMATFNPVPFLWAILKQLPKIK